MPTTGASLLIVAVLTVVVTISCSNCQVNATLFQTLACSVCSNLRSEAKETLLPCLTSKFTRKEDSCIVANIKEGFAKVKVPQCIIEDADIECHCSKKCSEEELIVILDSFANGGNSWESNCARQFLKLWKSTHLMVKRSVIITTTSFTETTGFKIAESANETTLPKVATTLSMESRKFPTRDTKDPIAPDSPSANRTSEEAIKHMDLRVARKRLLHTTTFKLFWIFCIMTFLMVCQLVLISIVRYETMHYAVASSSLTTESSHLDAQRTSSASSTSATASGGRAKPPERSPALPPTGGGV